MRRHKLADPDPGETRTSATAPRIDTRWLLFVFALALTIRVTYAVWIHPPSNFIFSDMKGYYELASHWLAQPWTPKRSAAFFPPGTSFLVALCRYLSFGWKPLCHALWALLAAPVAPLLMLTTQRLTQSNRTARTVGVLAAVYYPFVSFSGYFLSEAPFCTCLAAILWLTLCFADCGRRRDALALGFLIGSSSWLSPQILLSVPLLALFWLTRRRAFPMVRIRDFSWLAAGLFICLGATFAFTGYHSARATIVSQNGAVNRVFARCQNTVIKGRNGWFGLPPFGALEKWHQRRPHIPIKIRPVRGRTIAVPYRLDQEAKLHAVADDCVRRSNLTDQLRNSATTVSLLWAFNITWPDATLYPFGKIARAHNGLNMLFLLPATVVALFWLGMRRGREREGLLGTFMWTIIGSAAAFIGGTRLRTPFDTVMLVLAATVYLHFFRWLSDTIQARKARPSQLP